jgi:inorganic triphosphatase YgiF
MDTDPKEIELKLRVDPADAAALRNHPSFASALGNPVREALVSIYFDSDDMFMRDHGLTLRVRHSGSRRIQTIKAANPASGIFERSEWEKTIDDDRPELTDLADSGLGPLLIDEVRNGLKPVFETRVERTTYRVNGGDTEVAVSFDDGKIVAADSSCAISEIELELKRGSPGELFKLARSIGEIVPAWLDVKSKSERGYELLLDKTAPVEKAYDPDLPAGMTTGRAFTMIGRACLRQLLVNEPATRRRDPEALHQMRIGLRRLRAAISLFSDVVTDGRVEAIKAELKWLGAELAPARDLDSFLSEALRPLRKRQADQPGFESISRMFARERLKAYRRAREAVDSPRFRALVLDTAEWIEAGPWNSSDDPLTKARREMPVEILAAAQLARRSKKIRRRGAKIDSLDPEQLHKLRIQIKKTRYATEFFAGTFAGKKAAKRREKFHSSLKQLQTCLGGFNDIMMRKALCAEVLERPGRSLTEEQNRRRAFAAGLIIGDQQAQVRKLLDRAHKAHSRFEDAKSFWK